MLLLIGCLVAFSCKPSAIITVHPVTASVIEEGMMKGGFEFIEPKTFIKVRGPVTLLETPFSRFIVIPIAQITYFDRKHLLAKCT